MRSGRRGMGPVPQADLEMTGELLDSDVIIEILRQRKPEVVREWAALVDSEGPVFYSPLSQAEPEHGTRNDIRSNGPGRAMSFGQCAFAVSPGDFFDCDNATTGQSQHWRLAHVGASELSTNLVTVGVGDGLVVAYTRSGCSWHRKRLRVLATDPVLPHSRESGLKFPDSPLAVEQPGICARARHPPSDVG